jgi:hypothetical protein
MIHSLIREVAGRRADTKSHRAAATNEKPLRVTPRRGSRFLEHDPDLLFRGELLAGLAADVADSLLGRAFLGRGLFLLSESRTLS